MLPGAWSGHPPPTPADETTASLGRQNLVKAIQGFKPGWVGIRRFPAIFRGRRLILHFDLRFAIISDAVEAHGHYRIDDYRFSGTNHWRDRGAELDFDNAAGGGKIAALIIIFNIDDLNLVLSLIHI